ncbi:MAG: mechanosensitive ion channel family protein, partial [Gammaproteobacteria bacterium]|nr:mechanosensitive ion channel family protein [Gammaproteobacteria bacterium]
EMIADYFAGIAINFEQPYQIGDWVELENGVAGQVVEINWRATRLVTLAKVSVVVPNSELASRHFINYSQPTRVFRDSLEVVLGHTTDPERAANILYAAVLTTDGVVQDAKHDIKITGFSELGVVYQVRFWIDDYAKRAAIRDRVARNVLQHLNHAGIVMAVSQSEIFLSRRRQRRQEGRIDHRRLIARVTWLKALTDSELDTLSEKAIGRDFAKGDVIVRQNDRGDSLYVLVEGTLQASVETDQGPSVIGRIEPGEAFGEMSLLTGETRTATVSALTAAYVLEVRRDDLEPILRARPEIAEELGRLMAERQLAIERANTGESPASDTEMGNRALLIARRISKFFGLGGAEE